MTLQFLLRLLTSILRSMQGRGSLGLELLDELAFLEILLFRFPQCLSFAQELRRLLLALGEVLLCLKQPFPIIFQRRLLPLEFPLMIGFELLMPCRGLTLRSPSLILALA